nr:putative uncharacterized protein [uncultured bacterium]
MRLYDRDYSSLTPDEQSEWRSVKAKETVSKVGDLAITVNLFRDYPKAARHFTSLFPNNYLDIVELKDENRLHKYVKRFQQVLESPQVNERKILNFINKNQAYFIVGSLLKDRYSFGHHDAYLFPEFRLGNSHVVDYLLVGKSSDGWSFLFVEFESPNENITLRNGELGASFRKGLAQVSEWDQWLDGHFSSLTETFARLKSQSESLPQEFVTLNKTRIYYLVVAGRRTDFLERTYRERRKKLRDNAELLLHYDNVVDAAEKIIGRETY